MIDLFQMAPTFDDPLGMLRACHRRIERALAVIERIALREEEAALDEPTRDALRQTLHYFATGIPRHAADEEESLFPRVGAALLEGDLATARSMECLAHEHSLADQAHRELEALGKKLLEAGRFERPEERARFQELITTLQRLYQEHIRLEDEDLLPLAASLIDGQQREAIGREMAARRGIDWEQHRQAVARLEAHPWSRRHQIKETRQSGDLL
jgi:hemerythrin-like domain-containing protein